VSLLLWHLRVFASDSGLESRRTPMDRIGSFKRADELAGPAVRTRESRSEVNVLNLLGGHLPGGLAFAETLQAVAQPPLQRRWRIGIESYEIPERLAAVPAQPRQSVRVRVGMPRNILANR